MHQGFDLSVFGPASFDATIINNTIIGNLGEGVRTTLCPLLTT